MSYGRQRFEMFLDAWQFDGEFLDLGYSCKRLHRAKLNMLPYMERLRWRALAYFYFHVRVRRDRAIGRLHNLGEAYYRHEETDYVVRYTPNRDDIRNLGYTTEGVYENRNLHPLEQLAEIPEITQEQFDCGTELTRAEHWSQSWLRRVRSVETAMVCALYANDYVRTAVESAENQRGYVVLNGRHYFVHVQWDRVVDVWPRPGDVMLNLDPLNGAADLL